MLKYRYSILCISLILVLGIPFILKLKDPRLEIYPAVIFPSGDEKIYTSNSKVSFYQYELYAFNPKRSKMDKKELLGEIPIQYFYPIYQGHFGLEKYKNEFKLYKPPIKFKIENNFSKHAINSTKSWLRKRLIKSGYLDSIFIVKVLKTTFNFKTKAIENEEIVDEKIFRLH